MAVDTKDLHDLNNHLAVVLGFCDLLIEDSLPGDRRRRDLEEVRNAARAARDLVARLLPARDGDSD